MDKICKNCGLFKSKQGVCGVIVLVEGEQYELPVRPGDSCHWERVEREVNEEIKKEMERHTHPHFVSKFADELNTPFAFKQIKVWSDGKNGYVES